MDMTEQFIGAEEAASVLGVKVETLSKWRATGKGPQFYKIGRAPKYRATDLRAWMLKQVRQPGEGVR